MWGTTESAKPTDLARFFSKIKINNACWIWQGGKTKEGYGNFWYQNTNVKSHRFSYELLKGEIPENLTIDHLCRNPSCVNPEHLEAVTLKTNILRGAGLSAINAKKTKCIHGHPFNTKNTHIRKNGDRECRSCHREQENRRRLKLKIGG